MTKVQLMRMPFFLLFLLPALAHAQTPLEISVLDAARQHPLAGVDISIRPLSATSPVLKSTTDEQGQWFSILPSGNHYEVLIRKSGYGTLTDTLLTEAQPISYLAALHDSTYTHRQLPEANNSVPLPRLQPALPLDTPQEKIEPPHPVSDQDSGYGILLAELTNPLPEDAPLLQRFSPCILRTDNGRLYYITDVQRRKKAVCNNWKRYFKTPYPGTSVVNIRQGHIYPL
ncbi:MAG: carboxypeptidase regulatory-like domain-containing protein [Lewinellaceae bacterium]|nr:carboxypeptidase regulatory-like domain-containing protein [Lewinellaceae bacterium]